MWPGMETKTKRKKDVDEFIQSLVDLDIYQELTVDDAFRLKGYLKMFWNRAWRTAHNENNKK
jgi:hypothetical protein